MTTTETIIAEAKATSDAAWADLVAAGIAKEDARKAPLGVERAAYDVWDRAWKAWVTATNAFVLAEDASCS